MKKNFIFWAMAAFAVVGFTACGSDDEDFVAPKYDVTLDLPKYAATAASFENIGMKVGDKTLEGITFTEAGNAILEVAGDYISAAYTVANGVYTLTGAATGTITDKTTKGTTSTSTSITVSITIITIDGTTYKFNGDATADKQTATELTNNTDLNNICRVWTVKDMSLSLSGDVSMMKVYQSGDLSQLGKDANDNGAGLTADELDELNKTVQSIEFTKSGKFFLNYREGGVNVTQCATWESKDFHSFLIDKISESNKFITNGSSIQVVFNAVGGCVITFSTKITGSKNYDAQLIVNLI